MTPIRSDSSRPRRARPTRAGPPLPASRFAMTWRWMNSMLPTSRPRVGWSRTSDAQLAAELARDDRLLLVAAGQRAGRDVRGRRPDVVLADGLGGPHLAGVVVAQDAARVRRLVVLGEDEVVLEREAEHQPEAVAVAGHERHARLLQVARPDAGDVLAVERDACRPSACAARSRASTSSSWPLPATPAMPRISPARTSKLTPRTVSWPRSSLARRSVDLEHRPGRVRLASVDDELDLAADHQLGQVLLVRLGWDRASRRPAAPDDRDPVGDLEHLVQLVADEDDAPALVGEPAQDGEDLLGLLRRQDRGRLVEDEDARLAIERLEDLDALLPADREASRSWRRGRCRSRTASPSSRMRRSASLRSRKIGLAMISAPSRMLSATDSTGHEHEVLVDHADAARDGVVRAGDR